MKKISFFLLFLALLFNYACEKENVSLLDQPEFEASPPEGMMILGEKTPNAYTIENMTQAYLNLKRSSKKGAIELELPLIPTHYYIKFLPESESELHQLQIDTSLILFDFPLDYEIVGNGTFYLDPSLPDTVITWQYCVVERDFIFPDIKYEVIEDLFLPDSKIEETSKKGVGEWTFWDDLEIEALNIKGLGNDSEKKSITGTKIEPSGQIKISDNSGLGTFGLGGIKIIATRGFRSKPGLTDADGKFIIEYEFNGPVTYKIKWERDDFDIRSGTYGQAYFNGPKQELPWNYTIKRENDITWCYAHIHRSAHQYYYKNSNYGIVSPPRQGGLLNQRLHIGAMDKTGRSHYYDFNRFVFAATVKVYCKSGTSYRNSVDLFGTTIHELAHASHWNIGYSTKQYLVDYIFSKAFLPESWAVCIEHVITSDVYKTSSISSNRRWKSGQSATTASFQDGINDGYTPVFIDLMDNINQRDNGPAYPIDQVEGYTLSELEYVLFRTYNTLGGYAPSYLAPIWESFAIGIYKNKLADTYINSTEEHIDELFDNYL